MQEFRNWILLINNDEDDGHWNEKLACVQPDENL